MEIKCSYSKLVPVSQLVGHPKNTNKHPQKQIDILAKILAFQGFRHPIVVSNLSGHIVAGHGRLEAAQAAGFDEVPVDYQDFENAAQELAFLESDNLIADLAQHDLNAMIDNIKDLELDDDFDLELFGVPDLELPVEPDEAKAAIEDDVPEQVDTRCKEGDLWLLGEHRLLCGDSTNIQHVERLMGGKKAGLVHTDPPYNIGYEGGSKKREAIANDKLENFNDFLKQVYSNYFAVMHPGACIYVWHASTETHNFIKEFLDAGFLYKSYIIWNKNNSTFGRSDYHWKHEPAVYGWKDGGSHKWFGDRKQTTVWDIDRPSKSSEHPTMKPVELCVRAVENSSGPGMLVLDLFGGSGSTLIACEKTNRKCFMMELDPHYCDVILTRWENYTGKTAKLNET